MVNFQDIQTAYYMVAATGVLVAAIYYMMNLRHTRRTQELQVTMQTINLFSSSVFWDEYDELMSKEWSTLEEYHQKYGASFNFGHTVFITFEAMGVLLRRKLMDPGLPWDLYGTMAFGIWEKYKPVIMELRRTLAPDAALWKE